MEVYACCRQPLDGNGLYLNHPKPIQRTSDELTNWLIIHGNKQPSVVLLHGANDISWPASECTDNDLVYSQGCVRGRDIFPYD